MCLLIISLVTLSLNDSAGIKNVRRMSLATFSLMSSTVDWFSNLFVNDSELLEQKRLNAELMLQVNKLREYGLENLKLKKMLEYKESTSENLITSKVISKLVSDVQGVFVINKGIEDSVNVGMPVITERGLAGIVFETSGDYALVRNLHNPDLKITVTNQRSSIDGVMRFNGENLVIDNIPTTYDIMIGDRVVTSEFSTLFPPSIPVGVVTKTKTDISGVLNTLTIQPFVEVNSLRNVFVLRVIESFQIDSLELNLLRK